MDGKNYIRFVNYVDYIQHVITDKLLKHQHILTQTGDDKYYRLYAVDGNMFYECEINSIDNASNVTDYEANHLVGSNLAVGHENASLKMAKGQADTVNGIATINLSIPIGGRLILTALVWFETQTQGDYIKQCDVMNGETVVDSFVDPDVASVNKGWFIPINNELLVKGISKDRFVPVGLSLRMVAEKGDLSSDTLRANVRWGKR